MGLDFTRRFSWILVCVSTLLFLSVTSLVAQVSTGSITGMVSDPTGARIPGVTLEMTNVDTGVELTAASNDAGEFTIPLLQPGEYRLVAHSPGFRTRTQGGLVIESGRVMRLDISLELGEVAETVEVVGSAPLLESETATMGQFIENKTVTDMPLNGRRVGELLALMGNAVFVTGNVIRPRVAIAGGRADRQQWMLDGVNASNVALEAPQALFNPPVEATQEVRIQQNSYSAEYGNSSSGVVTITTKSGTNKLKGDLYWFFRNDALDAKNFFAADKPPLRWNVFGPAVGGPIIKNKTFFFVHNEWQKQRIGNVRRMTLPTTLQKSGDFSQTTNAGGNLIPIYDWTSQRPDPSNPSKTIRDPFPGNIIPSAMIDPVAANLMGFYPEPNSAPTNLAGANNFNGNNTNALNLSTLTMKIDHTFDENNRFTYRFVLHDFPTNNTPVFSKPAADSFANVSDRRAYSHLFNYIHSFSPTTINDLRVNWQPRRFQTGPLEADGGWPEQLGLKGVQGTAFPRVNASGFTAMGRTQQGRVQIPIHDTDIINNVSVFRNTHSIKFGGEIRLSRNQDDLRKWESGILTFATQPTGLPGKGGTGNALASMLVGFPNRGQTFIADILDRRAQYYALFVQDDWKVRSNFTLNIGVRWEAHTPKTDANDRQNGFDLFAINPVSGTPGVVTFAGRDGQGSTVYDGDWNNFGPRIGFAWRPREDGKWVIRSGYGLFFGVPVPGSNNMAAGFSDQGDFSTPDSGITPPFLLREGVPSSVREELGPGFGAVPVGSKAIFSPEFIDQDRQLEYTQMWNFNIQRDMGWSSVLEVSYVGNVGHKLARGTSINQVPVALMGPGNAQSRRPFPQFNNVTTVNRMWGNSSYHGFNVKFEKRFSQGLNFMANYTWSKFIDDVPAAQEAGTVSLGLQNLYDRAAEKALSGNHTPHRFVWSSVYELPLGTGRRYLSDSFAGKIIGGWNLGLIVTLQAGNPMALTMQTNTTNAFTPGPLRPDVLRDPTLPESERTLARWFDTEAVVAPAAYTFGNAGRALLYGPGLNNIDLSLLKNHRWGERFNVQFRFEAFNVVNHTNFNEPGRAVGNSSFGVISSARDARILQLGLKFQF